MNETSTWPSDFPPSIKVSRIKISITSPCDRERDRQTDRQIGWQTERF